MERFPFLEHVPDSLVINTNIERAHTNFTYTIALTLTTIRPESTKRRLKSSATWRCVVQWVVTGIQGDVAAFSYRLEQFEKKCFSLNITAIRPFEDSETIRQNIECHVPEDFRLPSHHCENLKSRTNTGISLHYMTENEPHGRIHPLSLVAEASS